jgi:hypothetical protein
MSLAVPADLLDRAQRGEVGDAAFLDCVRTSLPYAWDLVAGLVTDLEADGGEFADNQVPPPDESARGQLLRLMASDAMRAAVERHYGSGWRSRTVTAPPPSARTRPPRSPSSRRPGPSC